MEAAIAIDDWLLDSQRSSEKFYVMHLGTVCLERKTCFPLIRGSPAAGLQVCNCQGDSCRGHRKQRWRRTGEGGPVRCVCVKPVRFFMELAAIAVAG